MIISFRKNFIFIRTRKTASSTIETVLRKSLDSEDIYVGKGMLRHPSGEAALSSHDENIAGHMKAEDIIKIVPGSFWNSCFRFTSERHPYEKAVSLAFYNFGKAQVRTGEDNFAEFLKTTIERGRYRSFDQYTIAGKIVVDDFIRYENLVEDLNRIGQSIGVSIPEELPQKRTGFRTDRRPAREILSEEQRRQVFEICREEFELLGYEP